MWRITLTWPDGRTLTVPATVYARMPIADVAKARARLVPPMRVDADAWMTDEREGDDRG